MKFLVSDFCAHSIYVVALQSSRSLGNRIYWLVKNKETKLFNKNSYSDVWRVVPKHNRKDTGHIAVMPVEIAERIIETTDYKTFLDPFAGSGTTGVACQNLKRDFILIEKEPKYVEIIKQRLAPPPSLEI